MSKSVSDVGLEGTVVPCPEPQRGSSCYPGSVTKSDLIPSSLRFCVVDPDGHPVDDARVWLSAKDFDAPVAVGDASGLLQLTDLPAGKPLRVWIESEGFARRRLEDLHLAAGAELDLGLVILSGGPRLRVQVDPSEASLRLSYQYPTLRNSTSDWNGPRRPLTRGSDGHFESPPLPPGLIWLEARAPGRASRRELIPVTASTPDIDLGRLQLEPAEPLGGQVIDSRGQPIAGAQVWSDLWPMDPVVTDAEGAFRIDDLPSAANRPQEVRLRVNAKGFRRVAVRIIGSLPQLRIVLEAARAITIKVQDADSKAPLPVKTIRLCRQIRRKGAPKMSVG
ncbi:MAG: carboxypeptidase regulatory-like domain-containing protein [Planctomycetes bacterium]|nr:carboxypeptidase regulatory-like domain-containing protein [Planctomycetota bacterium]